jgi:hypothetical protein
MCPFLNVCYNIIKRDAERYVYVRGAKKQYASNALH